MREIYVKKKELNLKEFIKRTGLEEDIDEIIEEDCLIYDTESEDPIIIYFKIDTPLNLEILKRLKKLKFQKTERTLGLKTESRIFGYAPRIAIREDYCRRANLSIEDPEFNKILMEYGKNILQSYYKKFCPLTYKKHLEAIEKVLEEWKFTDVFTSGIINKNNPLKYHFDSGNFNDVYSNMIWFGEGIIGGNLLIPEYDLKFKYKNNYCIIFNGQKILHAVSPIKKLNENSYRYSIVYYGLQQMWKCLPLDEELARIRQKQANREWRRATLSKEQLRKELIGVKLPKKKK